MNARRPELEEAIGDILAALDECSGSWIELSCDALSLTPSVSTLGSTRIREIEHFYNDVGVVSLNVEISKQACRCLGLVFAASACRPKEEYRVRLRDLRSEFQEFNLINTSEDSREPLGFKFRLGKYERFPLAGYPAEKCADFQPCRDSPTDSPNVESVVRVRGSRSAFIELAQIFLSAGDASSKGLELDLESSLGNGGVAEGSAELKVWLPGSLGYLDAEPIVRNL